MLCDEAGALWSGNAGVNGGHYNFFQTYYMEVEMRQILVQHFGFFYITLHTACSIYFLHRELTVTALQATKGNYNIHVYANIFAIHMLTMSIKCPHLYCIKVRKSRLW